MDEITILNEMPVVLTKDEDFLKRLTEYTPLSPGRIFLLPKDAILVCLPMVKLKDKE